MKRELIHYPTGWTRWKTVWRGVLKSFWEGVGRLRYPKNTKQLKKMRTSVNVRKNRELYKKGDVIIVPLAQL